MAGRHWLAPILANWKARIQQEEAAALTALETKLTQDMAAADSQVRQDMTAVIGQQAQTLRGELAQMEGRLRDYVRSQMPTSPDGDGRAPRV